MKVVERNGFGSRSEHAKSSHALQRVEKWEKTSESRSDDYRAPIIEPNPNPMVRTARI
jgi:hypothetical protein